MGQLNPEEMVKKLGILGLHVFKFAQDKTMVFTGVIVGKLEFLVRKEDRKGMVSWVRKK
jgi:hypothetical protein